MGEHDNILWLTGATTKLSTLALARAYATLANGGRDPQTGAALIDSAAAATVLDMLEHGIADGSATGRRAAVTGLRIGGKTGTAGTPEDRTAVFAGFVTHAETTTAIVVAVEHLGPQRDYSGGSVAAPAFGRLASLAYGLALQ